MFMAKIFTATHMYSHIFFITKFTSINGRLLQMYQCKVITYTLIAKIVVDTKY